MSVDGPLDPRLLDELWDFDDAAGSERRLRAAAAGADELVAAELTTQIARALGLQGQFDRARELLDPLAAHPSPLVRARQALETGRLLRSGGDPAASRPWFESALELAAVAGDGAGDESGDYLRVDAMHMLALVDTDGDHWTERALNVTASATDPRVRRWSGALHNNRGWSHYEQQRYRQALADFEHALDAYRRYGTARQVRFAEQAVATCRQALAGADGPAGADDGAGPGPVTSR